MDSHCLSFFGVYGKLLWALWKSRKQDIFEATFSWGVLSGLQKKLATQKLQKIKSILQNCRTITTTRTKYTLLTMKTIYLLTLWWKSVQSIHHIRNKSLPNPLKEIQLDAVLDNLFSYSCWYWSYNNFRKHSHGEITRVNYWGFVPCQTTFVWSK